MTKLKALVAKIEKSKFGEQAFRVARLAGTGLIAYAVTHNGLAGVSVPAIVEAAFRQVFPSA